MGYRTHFTETVIGALLTCIVAVLFVAEPARADQPRQYAYAQPISYDLDDYGVVPMADVIAHAEKVVGGQVIEIKLDTKKMPSKWKYKTEVLRDDGRVVKIEHHAQTMTVLKYKLKH